MELVIKDLHVSVKEAEILKGVSLIVKSGEIAALMGPNGSGKSTLSYVLMGHPDYQVTKGSVTLDGQDLLQLPPNERAKLGIFLSFQYPAEISGVSVANFLRTAYNSVKGTEISPLEFRKMLKVKMELLHVDDRFAERYLNEGFSGGEKKRNEILQMAVLQPRLAILDETDSGLDIDALRTVANGVNQIFNKDMALLVITHYQRLLNYIKPHRVHVMLDGRIVKSGGAELVEQLEAKGYEEFKD